MSGVRVGALASWLAVAIIACGGGGSKPGDPASAKSGLTCEAHCDHISEKCGAHIDRQACGDYCKGFWQRADASKPGCEQASSDLFACREAFNIDVCNFKEQADNEAFKRRCASQLKGLNACEK
jgi:hypothetical protein